MRVLDELASEPRPATVARHFVRSTLASWGEADEVAGMVELAVSELVANAVQHGGGPTRMAVRRQQQAIRVEVSDRTAGQPVVVRPGDLDEGHRGMLIVDSVSTRWGHQPAPGGKVVWAEFTRGD